MSDREEILAELAAVIDTDDEFNVPAEERLVELDLLERLMELIVQGEQPPKVRKFVCMTAFIETTDPDVTKVAARARRELELAFGENLIGTEWSIREGTR